MAELGDVSLDTSPDAAEGAAPAGVGPPPEQLKAAKKAANAIARMLAQRRLYHKENEATRKAKDELHASLTHFLNKFGTLRWRVGQSDLLLGGESVLNDERQEDSLPFMLYLEGVRELIVLEGLDDDEMDELVDVLAEGFEGGTSGDDLVTKMWRKDFAHIDYVVVDDISDSEDAGDEEIDPDDPDADEKRKAQSKKKSEGTGYQLDGGTAVLEEILAPTRDQGNLESGAHRVGVGLFGADLDALRALQEASPEEGGGGATITGKSDAEAFLDLKHVPVGNRQKLREIGNLFQLQEAERAELDAEVGADDYASLLPRVSEIVFRTLSSGPADLAAESFAALYVEIVQEVIRQGAPAEAREILDRLEAEAGDPSDPSQDATRKGLEMIRGTLASTEMLAPLGKTLALGTEETAYEVSAYLAALGPQATAAGRRLLDAVTDPEKRAPIVEFVVHQVLEAGTEVDDLIASTHDDLVATVIEELGRRGSTSLVYFLRTIRHPEVNVRLRTIEALTVDADGRRAELLAKALEDDDASVRMAALKALTHIARPEAFDALAEEVVQTYFHDFDREERTAFFQALVACSASDAVDLIESFAFKKRLLNRTHYDETRRLALLALATADTPRARTVLERGAATGDKAIKTACARALQRYDTSHTGSGGRA